MYPLATITSFFGWCSVIGIMLLTFSSIMVISLRHKTAQIHGKMFHLEEDQLSKLYFQYLAQFKIALIILNIIPYFALKIIG